MPTTSQLPGRKQFSPDKPPNRLLVVGVTILVSVSALAFAVSGSVVAMALSGLWR